MKFKKLIPIIYTNNLQQTIQFYVQTFGFTCSAKDTIAGWASIELDQVEMMISLPNEHMEFQKPVFSGSFYIRTENVDLLWNNINEDVKVCYPIENFDYGMREFAVYDNNGYLLQFGEELPTDDI